jgi:hypothetical protein
VDVLAGAVCCRMIDDLRGESIISRFEVLSTFLLLL